MSASAWMTSVATPQPPRLQLQLLLLRSQGPLQTAHPRRGSKIVRRMLPLACNRATRKHSRLNSDSSLPASAGHNLHSHHTRAVECRCRHREPCGLSASHSRRWALREEGLGSCI